LKWNSPRARYKSNSPPGLLLLLCCLTVLFFSCGIEEEIYLEPVVNVYRQEGVTRGSLTLPDNSSSNYFRYYMIYYRIYLSDYSTTSINSSDPQELQRINPSLSSHWSSINSSYIANENTSTSGLGSTFSSIRYYPLFVTNANEIFAMNEFLSPQMYGNTGVGIGFNFLPGDNAPPRMEINNTTFSLFRDSSNFTPRPDRLFFLHTDMISPITNEENADVQPNGSAFAYVSLYICAVGIDNNFSPVFSRPAHIGVFQLPNRPNQ